MNLMRSLRFASVCTGVGLFELAAHWNGWNCVFTSEIKPFCQRVLAKRFPDTAHYGDFTTKHFRAFARRHYRSRIDVLAAGLPCQPFSVAGLKKGQLDERHLGPAFVELCAAIRPAWVVVENVAGFIKMALDDFASAMEAKGYSVQAFVLPACAVGAPHRRDRVWIICHNPANADSINGRLERERTGRNRTGTRHQSGRCAADVAGFNQNAYRSADGEPSTSRRFGELRDASSANEIRHPANAYDSQRNRSRIVRNQRAKPADRLTRPNTYANRQRQPQPERTEQNQSGRAGYGDQRQFTDARPINGQIGLHGKSQAGWSPGKPTNGLAGFDGWAEHWYEAATRICGMDDGDAAGLDGSGVGSRYLEYRPTGRYRTARLEAGGNGLIAHIPYELFKLIRQHYNQSQK